TCVRPIWLGQCAEARSDAGARGIGTADSAEECGNETLQKAVVQHATAHCRTLYHTPHVSHPISQYFLLSLSGTVLAKSLDSSGKPSPAGGEKWTVDHDSIRHGSNKG